MMVKLLDSLLFLFVYTSIEILGNPMREQERIVGGTYARLGQFPYVVAIEERPKVGASFTHVCAGGIMSRKWILTAAHCMRYKPDHYRIVAGITGIMDKTKKRQSQYVKTIIQHPDYVAADPSFLAIYDIALLEVNHLKYNQYVQHLTLPEPNAEPKGNSAILSGWGAINTAGNVWRMRLKSIEIAIPDQTRCNHYYPEFSPKIHLCTLPTKNKGGACVDDEGDPLVQNNTIIGVVSTTDYPCGTITPTIYAKVSGVVDFIKHTIH